MNVIAGDQYVADVLPARMYRDEFERRGLPPELLSRSVEDSGTVTSVLVPWNNTSPPGVSPSPPYLGGR